MPPFLLEIGTEEIPVSYLRPAVLEIKHKLIAFFDESSITHGEMKVFYTPRRLAVLCEDVALKQKDTTALVSGPPASKAFDENGKPTGTAIGFAKAHGISVETLETKETAKGKVVVFQQKKRGRRVSSLLAGFIPELLASIYFPKSMSWEKSKFRFARPIRWIVALLGSQTIRFKVAGVKSGQTTIGHRFLSPRPKKIEDPAEYEKTLGKMHVVADPGKRKEQIMSMLTKAAGSVKGVVIDDPELVDEVNGLVEEPNPIVGKFDEKYLKLPQEVVVTAMREHQRYFSVVNRSGTLLPFFVAIANGKTRNDRIVKKGYQDILVSKLEDASFHWQEDTKHKLDQMAEQLKNVVWQENLGSLHDKCLRLVELAKHLCLRIDQADAECAKRAAYLCKADLVSNMVRDGKEFAKLQGIMGREYALIAGEKKRVAIAIEQHYLPRYPGDSLPETPEGAVVSIADRLDSIVGSFINGKIPTGSEDPYGLRRLANGMITVLVEGKHHISLSSLLSAEMELYTQQYKGCSIDRDALACSLFEFFSTRMEAYLGDKSISFDVARAVMSNGPEDPTDIVLRASALSRFRQSEEFRRLVVGQKRVSNILKGVEVEALLDESLLAESMEKELLASTKKIESKLQKSIEDHEYDRALGFLLSLRDPIDRFFDQVLVMAEDETIRNNRLALVRYVAARFSRLADFSKIVVD